MILFEQLANLLNVPEPGLLLVTSIFLGGCSHFTQKLKNEKYNNNTTKQ